MQGLIIEWHSGYRFIPLAAIEYIQSIGDGKFKVMHGAGGGFTDAIADANELVIRDYSEYLKLVTK